MVMAMLTLISSVVAVRADCGVAGVGYLSKKWEKFDGTTSACDCDSKCCKSGLAGVSGYTRSRGTCYCQMDANPSQHSDVGSVSGRCSGSFAADEVVLQGSVGCTSGCNAACYNMGEHCCGQDGNTCHCKPTGVSCASEPVNTSNALELMIEGLSAPACTSGCNSACYNMGEHCCGQDGDQCTCRPIGVSCAAEPANESSVQVILNEEVSHPTCTSGCNAACYNMGEHCCSESGGTCYCKPTGVSCGAAPVNISDVLELVKEEFSAPACTSGCNAACYNMGEHCCGQDGNQCTCRPIGVSCASEPDNQVKKLVVKDDVSAPSCTSGCNSACYNMGEHCCGQDGNTCHCKPTGVSCASEPVNKSTALALVQDELSLPTCTSGCNAACYNMGAHCCSQDGNTCHCQPIGVSCGSGQPNASRDIDLVKEDNVDDALMAKTGCGKLVDIDMGGTASGGKIEPHPDSAHECCYACIGDKNALGYTWSASECWCWSSLHPHPVTGHTSGQISRPKTTTTAKWVTV